MHVSIDCRYIRERPSGIGVYTQEIVERISQLAPADRFRLILDPRAPRPLLQRTNVEERSVIFQANSLPTLLWPSFLADLRWADVFHATFNLLGRGVQCATVVTLHDLIWLFSPLSSERLTWLSPAQMLFYRNGIMRALKSATRIVCISKATADSVACIWPEAKKRLRVIYHGVSKRFCPPVDIQDVQRRAAQILNTEAPYFLVMGQNAPSKNHEAVEKAFVESGLNRNHRLVLVQRLFGPASSARELSDRKLGIVRLPAISGCDALTLLQGARALVQFSRFEGFGMPALEAMACGTPVLASDTPALVELLAGAGLCVPLDVRDLADALRRLAAEPSLRNELSARGQERARVFCWQRSAELHYEVYREAFNASLCSGALQH